MEVDGVIEELAENQTGEALKLLLQELDEQHLLFTNQICVYMLSIDIPLRRRVVSHDVGLLNEMGFEIMEMWVGKKQSILYRGQEHYCF